MSGRGQNKTRGITYKGMTGVNLPMLICAVNHRNLPLADLYSKVEKAKDKSINEGNKHLLTFISF